MPGTPRSASQRRAPGRLRRLGVETTTRPPGASRDAERPQAGARVLEVLQHVGQADEVERGPPAGRRRCPRRPTGDPRRPISARRRDACATDSGDRSTPTPEKPRAARRSSRKPVPQPTSRTLPPPLGRAVAVDGLEHERHAALEVPVLRLDRDEPGRQPVVVGPDPAQAPRLPKTGPRPPPLSGGGARPGSRPEPRGRRVRRRGRREAGVGGLAGAVGAQQAAGPAGVVLEVEPGDEPAPAGSGPPPPWSRRPRRPAAPRSRSSGGIGCRTCGSPSLSRGPARLAQAYPPAGSPAGGCSRRARRTPAGASRSGRGGGSTRRGAGPRRPPGGRSRGCPPRRGRRWGTTAASCRRGRPPRR